MKLRNLALLFFAIGPSQATAASGASFWNTIEEWRVSDFGYTSTLDGTLTIAYCKKNRDDKIIFPSVIQGVHEVVLDGVSIRKYGDHSFSSVFSFYDAPTVACSEVVHGESLQWKISAFSKQFAKSAAFPRFEKSHNQGLFNGSVRIFGAGLLVAMSLFSGVFISGKIPKAIARSVIVATGSLAISMVTTTPGFFGLPGTMAFYQKVSDGTLILGGTFLLHVLCSLGFLPRLIFKLMAVVGVVGCALLLFAKSGDSMQNGTNVVFVPWVISFLLMTFIAGRKSLLDRSLKSFLPFCAVLLLSVSSVNDILVTLDLYETALLFPFGMCFGWLLIILAVSENINVAYIELAHLKTKLEEEVRIKTQQVVEKAANLETTLKDLQIAQANLIQSEKLASLGTMAAGIAHEINNSLNFVNGSVRPLEKLVTSIPDETSRSKALKLTSVMQEGLRLTFEIIKSLRTYTGLNQASYSDYKLLDVVRSVLTMIKSKIRDDIEVLVEIPDAVILSGNVVGINQVMMNLITNASDALPNGGKIAIRAFSTGEMVELVVEDSGVGIPEGILSKIFDPFFTTKGVGEGTGLGLHIVKSEISKQGGRIKVESSLGSGTRFVIELPRVAREVRGAA